MAGTAVQSSNPEELLFLKLLTENRRALGTEPVFENRCVDTAEVGGEPQVAVVKIGQTRVRAIEAGLDAGTKDKHWRGRAVVGAAAGVLRDATAELAERHREHAACIALIRQILLERSYA